MLAITPSPSKQSSQKSCRQPVPLHPVRCQPGQTVHIMYYELLNPVQWRLWDSRSHGAVHINKRHSPCKQGRQKSCRQPVPLHTVQG